MKNLFIIIALIFGFGFCFTSCEEDEVFVETEEYLAAVKKITDCGLPAPGDGEVFVTHWLVHWGELFGNKYCPSGLSKSGHKDGYETFEGTITREINGLNFNFRIKACVIEENGNRTLCSDDCPAYIKVTKK